MYAARFMCCIGRIAPLAVLVLVSASVPAGLPAQGISDVSLTPFVTGIIPVIGRGGGAVGGVSIDAQGVLANPEVDELEELARQRAESVAGLSGDLSRSSPLRKISLRRLEAAIDGHRREGTPLGDDILYLAGVQRLRYVFVYPDTRDVVLAGPAEGWQADAQGNLVGRSTGQPVVWLDDLLVALRTAENAAQGGITCSIDPTADGLAQLTRLLGQRRGLASGPQDLMPAMEEAVGPQQITLTGIPAGSHFARVLVSADYRMKRLAMGFEPAPIADLPSFLSLLKAKRVPPSTMTPRWWLAPDYQPLLRDPEGLTWELRGAGVRAESEESFLPAAGGARGKSAAHGPMQAWAGNLSEHYAELSLKLPVFAELRNCMDLAVAAALIARENLFGRAALELPLLLDESRLQVAKFPAPRQVASQASCVKQGRNWLISVSGGVAVDSWQAIEKSEESGALAATRREAATTDAAAADSAPWWWD